MRQATFGTISHGTLRNVDLIEALSAELIDLVTAESTGAHADLIAACNTWLDREEELGDDLDPVLEEDGSDLVSELIDALNEHAPLYGYFGAHEGDGSDFGFWLFDDVARMVKDDGGLVVEDTADVPDDYMGEVLHINDHGNATLYAANAGKLTQVWAAV